jgi:NADPH2:quinone reductase
VSYGSSSGPVAPFSIAELVKRGSLFVTRPALFDYTADRADLEAISRETFAAVRKKWLKVRIHQRYRLEDAAQAHRDLESRKTTGASVIIP